MAVLTIKRMPEDISLYLKQIQKEIKDKKGIKQFSLELTAISIMREHKEDKEKKQP
jgi:hypothetical protein